jgi:hypothetical protein
MRNTRNNGLVSIILILIIAILALSYLNIDLKSLVEKPQTKNNVAYVATTSETVWTTYLEKPATYLWNKVFIDLFWNSFIDNMTAIKNNTPTTMQQQAPLVNTN